MKTELILKSDVLDIIFEHRNKSYGAYNLRKFYDNRLMKSIAVMLGLVTVLSAFTFISPKKTVLDDKDIETTMYVLHPPEKKPEIKEKKAIPPPSAPQKPMNTRKFMSNIVIKKDDSVVDKIDVIKPNDLIGKVNIDVPGDGPVVVKIPGDGGPGGVGGTGNKPAEPPVDIFTPTASPEEMPTFPGGLEGLKKFLERHLTNPRDLEEGEAISVKMRFVVGYDGKLKSFETVQDGGSEFNKEVIRVLKKMPDWIPGKTKGQNVSVYYTIPVKFIAEK